MSSAASPAAAPCGEECQLQNIVTTNPDNVDAVIEGLLTETSLDYSNMTGNEVAVVSNSTETPEALKPEEWHMPSGLLAGAVIGGAIVLGIVIAIFLVWRWHRRRRRRLTEQEKFENGQHSTFNGEIALATRMQNDENAFLSSVSASATLRRDPVLRWVASGLRHRDETSSIDSESSVVANNQKNYRLIDIKEIAIHHLLGEGSFGRVFAANWNQCDVAFKMLVDSRHLGHDETAEAENARIAAALEREAGLMAGLRHPNIVQFLGACAFPPGLLTEWVSRGSLHVLLQKSQDDDLVAAQLTWQRRLCIALDAAKGMLYLHSNKPSPIIHRDLKSANLLVARDWTCKVCDFNLSRIFEEHGRMTSSSAGSGPGNPRWLAPEIFNGDTFTKASDVYSFGMVMYELLVSDLPFKNRNEWGVVGAVQAGERPVIPSKEELLSAFATTAEQLDAYLNLMQRAWAQDPPARPTFEEIATELSALTAQNAVNYSAD